MPKKVPYLQEEQIERDAAGLLAEYEQARGVKIERAVPIEDIVEKHLKLGIEFDDMHRLLNHPRSGLGLDPDILGAIFFEERAAVIGACIAACSPRTRRRSPCSTNRPRPRWSVGRARRRSRLNGRRISMRRAF